MNNVEKAVAALAIIGAIFGAGAAWQGMSNRFDSVNHQVEKVAARVEKLEKTGTDAPCMAILTRQIVAIERNAAAVLVNLDKLAERYQCSSRTINLGKLGVILRDPNKGPSADQMYQEWLRNQPETNSIDSGLNHSLKKIDAQLTAGSVLSSQNKTEPQNK